MPDFPPVAEILPHRGRAVLLGHVLEHDSCRTVCSVDPADSAGFQDADGFVPASIGLEYMAQTVAAHGGLVARTAGEPVRPGFFLGSRRVDFSVARFAPGEILEVTATHVRGGSRALAFDCAIRRRTGEPPMVSGVLTVYLLESFEALTAGDEPRSGNAGGQTGGAGEQSAGSGERIGGAPKGAVKKDE